jgi:hypothetical protein
MHCSADDKLVVPSLAVRNTQDFHLGLRNRQADQLAVHRVRGFVDVVVRIFVGFVDIVVRIFVGFD